MYLLKQIRPVLPLIIGMIILFGLGIYCMALSFNYENCYMSDSIDLDAICAETFIKELFFPFGLITERS